MAALDPMDFLMHQGETGTSQEPSSGFHGLPQHQGCPYFRAHAQQHHGSSLPPLNLDGGFYPMPHHTGHPSGHPSGPQHPQQQPQQQQQQTQHSQSQAPQTQPQPQPQPQPPTHSHHSHSYSHSRSHSHPYTHPPPLPQPQPQSQPSQQLPPLQPPTLPYPHSHHSPFDPVWYSSPPPSVWSSAGLHPYPIPPSHGRPSGADSHFGGPSSGSGSGSGSASGSGSGAGLVQPHQQFLPRPDQYMPWSFEGYHRSTAYPHSSIVLPMPPPLSNHSHPSRQGPSDQNQSNQSNPPNRSSRPANSNTPPLPMSSERSAPPPSGRGLTLPSLNPNANQSPTGLQATPPAMSNSRASDSPESSPTAQPPSLLDRPSAFRFPDDPARPSNRGNGEGVPLAPTHAPQLPLPSEFPGMQYPRTDGFMADRGNLPHGSGHPPPNLTPPSLSSRRQQLLARRLGQPEHDSDEDLGSSADEEEQMLRYLDEFGVNPTHFRSLVAEDHIRAAQVLRGQLPNKRVASKKALGQLQSVDLDSLSESERTCVICYNDFGQASPEGVIEAPLRLPKCQHVFGDHCIKKWFEESDSCPYCRDKVPSEVALAPSLRTYQNLFRMRRMPGGSSSLTPNDDSILRILAQQETREVARLRARQEGGPDNLSPRPFQPRERRSPPSEAMENRRRTRARHSSFHPSYPAGFAVGRASAASHTAGASALGQQSPSRERSMTTGQRLFYTPTDPGHASNSVSQHDQSTPTPAVFRLGPSPPMQMTPHNPYYPSMPYGAPPPAPYSQQQPTMGSLTPPHFQNPTSSGNNGGPDPTGSEGQLQ